MLNETQRPWTQTRAQVLEQLSVLPDQGLERDAVRRRRREHGPNRLRQAQSKSAWRSLGEQFKSILAFSWRLPLR